MFRSALQFLCAGVQIFLRFGKSQGKGKEKAVCSITLLAVQAACCYENWISSGRTATDRARGPIQELAALSLLLTRNPARVGNVSCYKLVQLWAFYCLQTTIAVQVRKVSEHIRLIRLQGLGSLKEGCTISKFR